MKIPRFLLTAGASGSGKTLITCGILQALKNRGMKAASFKCGPDYIDPMFHTKVLGTKSRNLDTFFCNRETVRYLLKENAQDCDIAVMEGVMGYYDGVGGTTVQASAYELARETETPAVLIVNCKGMSLSVVPYIQGFAEFREDSRICGVILNQLSPMLYGRLKKLIEEHLDIAVLGYVPKAEEFAIESRHLGLILPDEVQDFQEKLNRFAQILEETLNLDRLLEIAAKAPEIEEKEFSFHSDSKGFCEEHPVKIGVAMDEAFCFIYEDNLKLLRTLGAKIVPFSPLHEKRLPEGLSGMLLYGGYPELFGKELEDNREMREEIRSKIQGGMPVMAECGGFMYLHETFENMDRENCEGVGIIRGRAYRTPRLSRFGYIEVTKKEGTVFGQEIGSCPAHEFHYFDSTNCGTDFHAQKPKSSRGWDCIHSTDSIVAGFPHFYYYGNPRLAEAFVKKCREYAER